MCSYLVENSSSSQHRLLLKAAPVDTSSICRLFMNLLLASFHRYGRVYATAADPYHHSVGPTTTYGVGTMVSWVKTHRWALVKAHFRVLLVVVAVCRQASLYRGGYNRFTPYWASRERGSPEHRHRLIHGRCRTGHEIHETWFPPVATTTCPWETKQAEGVNTSLLSREEDVNIYTTASKLSWTIVFWV